MQLRVYSGLGFAISLDGLVSQRSTTGSQRNELAERAKTGGSPPRNDDALP
jgi:hypothetical protein